MIKKITFFAILLFQLSTIFSQNSWQDILKNKRGKVIIHFYDSENYIYFKNNKLTGIEYDLLLAFISFLEKRHKVSIETEFIHANSFANLFERIHFGKSGEFGACSFSITAERLKQVNFTPKYMADVELLLSTRDYDIAADTSMFIKQFANATAYVVKNTTFEEDLNQLKKFIPSLKVKYVNTGIEIIDRISNSKRALGFAELPNYLTYIKREQHFVRQSLFKFERTGHGIIYPKSSDWTDAVNEFFSSKSFKFTIKKILYKHLGNDIQDLLWEKEKHNKINEINLLNKEIEIQKVAIEKQELEAKNQALERDIFGLVGLFILILLILVFLNNKKNKKVNRILNRQKAVIEEANKNILDSITYAKRIQSAILPQPKLVKEFLKDSFICYKPKDIVAGDFYWLEVVGSKILFAAADCTGHGVPGALVSVVCNNKLNRSVREYGLTSPDDILNKTRELVVKEFEKSDEDVKDGMDISLCALNIDNNKLKWAGANNPLWILRNNEVMEYKADKQPIGRHFDEKPFSFKEIQLLKNDIIYIFTDGFQDQFGGEFEKKYRLSRMRELFLSIANKPMEEQRKIIDEVFEKWRGDLEQVDDVCIIGVRI